ncbi:DUF3265 domain-containing protein [Vibrio parahaemolyticus]|nr:DUF3265 domain-containing protein [Vibrio parahaemolyticus]
MFKSDSARVAFFLCVRFSGYGGMRKLRYCVPHTLTRRYVYLYFNGLKTLRTLFLVPLAIRPSCLSKSVLSAQILEFLNL